MKVSPAEKARLKQTLTFSNVVSENREHRQNIAGDCKTETTSVERAVAWLVVHLDDCPRPIIPYIKQAYDLCNLDACEAIRLATLKRGEGAA